MTEKSLSLKSAFGAGWRCARANVWILLGLLLVELAAGVAAERLGKMPMSWAALALLLGAVALQLWLGAVLFKLRLDISRAHALGQAPPQLRAPGPRSVLRYLGALLAVVLIVLGGLLLLLAPGLYWLAKYGFAAQLALDEGLGLRGALRRSAELSQGLRWKLLAFDLLAFALLLLEFFALLASLVGLFAPWLLLAWLGLPGLLALLPARLAAQMAGLWIYDELRRQAPAELPRP